MKKAIIFLIIFLMCFAYFYVAYSIGHKDGYEKGRKDLVNDVVEMTEDNKENCFCTWYKFEHYENDDEVVLINKDCNK